MLFLIAAAVAAQSPTPPGYVSLSSTNGATLVRQCRESPGAVNNFCTGYLLGVADALQVANITCRPQSDVATLQTYEIVHRYIVAHPERWDRHGYALVAEALIETFPCRATRTTPARRP
ncbi:MAG TPA: Rap1a/Tai family immunity protein [Allosphingosinicella sp.]|jgi:hypothetical protein|nr:Rap1a/Tai family immunity protein [Allosphingosinicella sp.]